MSKHDTRLSVDLPPGRKAKHGGYSFISTGKLPEHRRYILSYLTAARAGLVRDLGPTEENLTAAQIILIDRIVTKLGIIRCIEEHTRETAVMKGNQLSPSLGKNYLGFNNSLRLDLSALGIDKRQGEAFDLKGYVKEKYGDKGAGTSSKKHTGRQEKPPKGRTPADEGKTTGRKRK